MSSRARKVKNPLIPLGIFVSLAALIMATVWCVGQFEDVSALSLNANPAEWSEGQNVPWDDYLAYTAKIDDKVVPVGGLQINLEDQNAIEFYCKDSQIQVRNLPANTIVPDNSLPYFRLTNNCQSPVSVKICWFNSFLKVIIVPNCAI